MKPRSAQAKGKRFEKYIAEQIEEAGFGKARREIGSGSGKFKGDIFSSIPWLFECKDHKKLDIWGSIRQAQREAEQGNSNPDKWALLIREPRSPTENPNVYAVIDFWQFLNLLKSSAEPKVKEPDKEMKWDLLQLKTIANKVLKRL